MTKGGARIGSGRKPLPDNKKRKRQMITDEEMELIRFIRDNNIERAIEKLKREENNV